MPTFKNNTTRIVDYECTVQSPTDGPKKILIRFDPGKEVALPFYVPHEKLGLTLVNANQPKVPPTVLLSGTFNFADNVERRFNIELCDTYILNVIVQKGKVALYAAGTDVPVEIAQDAESPYHYRAVYDWEFAPYIRVKGVGAASTATVHAEVDRGATLLKQLGLR